MKTYINLSAGLLASEYITGSCKFTRIRSSHIESQAWNQIFMCLDEGFLYDIAVTNVLLIDCTSNDKSKICNHFVPVLEYVLNRLWLGIDVCCYPRIGMKRMNEIYNALDKKTKNKIRYYKKFNTHKEIKIITKTIKVHKEFVNF